VLHRPRINATIRDRRPLRSVPGHALVVADSEQELELLAEQRVVVPEIEAEQWERLRERPAPRHDLGAAIRE